MKCPCIHLFIVLISIASSVHADEMSLPLSGYFHPGRAMPVRWRTTQSGELEVSSDGIASRADSSNAAWGILPCIVIDPNTRALRWTGPSQSAGEITNLHPLSDSDFLVGNTLPASTGPAAIFPDRHAVPIHLDPVDLQSPPMAWESLDALVMTSSDWEKLPLAIQNNLVAEGITIAIEGEKPGNPFPWKRADRFWIAATNIPMPPIISADADAPLDGVIIGRSDSFRHRIVLLGAMYCLIACGIAMWRSRWMPMAFVALTAGAGALLAIDNSHQSPIFQKAKTVRLEGEIPLQETWVYQVSHRPVGFRLPVEGVVQPIFSDESEIGQMNLTLRCGSSGEPISMDGFLPVDVPLAVMIRRLASDQIFTKLDGSSH
jgi:hypothetical protein